MKKILNALFLTLLAVFTFSSCSDVPAPYDILGEGDLPGMTGDGTKENPYNIETAQKKQDGSIAWVQGYIVGCVDGEGKAIATESKFEAPFTIASNLLIADTPDETNYKNCVPVQLVGGSDVRTALNLKDNAANLGKVVMIYGSLEKYFGVAGLKSPTAAVLDGVEIGEGGSELPSGSLVEKLDATNPVNQVVNTFDEAEKDKDYLKEGYVNFAEVGGRTWRGKPHEGNGLIQATAYGSKQASVISWFVTPAVNVAQMEVKKVTFDCISAYYKEGTKLEVYFLEKNGNELNQTLLNVGNLPQSADGYSEPVTLTGDLTAIGDKVGFIGFKYIGSDEASGTYQIDNLYVGVEAGENPGPEQPGDGTELLTNGGFEDWAEGYPVNWKSASTASNATLEQSSDKRNGTYSVLVKGTNANKRLGSAEMTLKAGTYTFSAYFKAATNENASARLGYALVGTDGAIGGSDYKYDDYVNDITNKEWVTKSYTFTLETEQKICLVIMNPKNPGKDVLVDDASLKTTDGGIVGGDEPEQPKPSVGNLLVNPGFEEWGETLPTAWDNSKYNTGEITKETSFKHGGNNSLRQKSDDGTQKIQQEVAVKGGKKYRISYWFLDNDPKARSRYWFALVDGEGKTVNDLNSEIQQSAYSEDNPEWQQVKIEVTLPENVVKMRYEVRTYRGEDAKGTGGGYIYYDDMELVEIE
ncbi:DUF6359 domain-containing protein [Bacteroides caecimuris]|uniref:DUF6359 domain-containing protein n=1 Tax=Bacteroides caecimuris TaxID=1796613 RepID=UPI001C3CC7C9|nr:DUF6359 domain-containing protein [Bacteroides caecimuris]